MMAGGRYIHPDVRQMVWDAMENSFPNIFNEHAQRYNLPPFEPPSYAPHDAEATHPSQRQPPSTGPFRPPFRRPRRSSPPPSRNSPVRHANPRMPHFPEQFEFQGGPIRL